MPRLRQLLTRPGRLAAVGALAAATGLLSACSEEESDTAQQQGPPPPRVEVAQATTATVQEYFEYTGVFESVDRAEVRARVPGILETKAFRDSTDVEAGELLFTIEPEPYEVAVRRAEAAVSRAEAALRLAEARLERTRDAFEANAAAELELIEQRANVDLAEAELASARAELDDRRIDLGYTTVSAPIAGRVGEALVDIGNLVGDGEPTLLATVVKMDPIHVYFDVSERIALRYLDMGRSGAVGDEIERQVTDEVSVGLLDEQGYPHTGSLDFAANELDPQTGTIRVRAILQNDDAQFYPGLFARIRVTFRDIENAVLVRQNAIGTDLGGKHVFVVKGDDIVERRRVEPGQAQAGGMIHIVEGLRPGETYIVSGLVNARPGAKVNPVPASSAPDDEAEPGEAVPARGSRSNQRRSGDADSEPSPDSIQSPDPTQSDDGG